MKTRSSDVQVAANRGGKRKAPEGDEHGRGKRRSVKSDEPKSSPQIDRRLAPKRTILRGIHGCVSPRCSASTHRSSFSWYEQDAWTYISRFLDGKSLVMLGATSKWFNKMVMEDDAIWRFACLRDLRVPKLYPASSSWIKIYASAFDGRSHSYLFHQQEKHIGQSLNLIHVPLKLLHLADDTVSTDWMRIGAFTLDSGVSLLTEKLSSPLRVPREGTIERMLESSGGCIVKDIKSGIWIADLQLVRCPVCDLSTCDGTMQTLDARHVELFLNEGYKNGTWEYNLIASHKLQKDAVAACGAIFDLKHLKSSSSGILNLKSWTGAPDDSQPKAMIAPHAVALHTRLQENEDIDSEKQLIRLNDPNNRMARRLLSFDASGTPFSPLHLLNHTILTCPSEDIKSSSPYTPIICFGNSTSSFFATRFDLASSMPSSCQVFKTLLLPVSSLVAVHLNDQDLWLKWDSPSGRDCEGSSSLRLYNFILLILKLICLSLMTLLFGITTCVVYVTFMKVEKNMKLPGKNNNICSICLSEYASSETVGCLLICEHCFHVECIDTWLQLRSSCPICRNSSLH
ncbi:unnamed protein product [Brassica napus]|uniref:(rape) hypothetical protein n=1 Tax=Brassica napus TaxID=3708 RepID=A0A817ATJ2_BRANA|nr:unnamed protein product [Brassica napus]